MRWLQCILIYSLFIICINHLNLKAVYYLLTPITLTLGSISTTTNTNKIAEISPNPIDKLADNSKETMITDKYCTK